MTLNEEQRLALYGFSHFLHQKADASEGTVPGSYADGMRNAAIDATMFELDWIENNMPNMQQNPDGTWSPATPMGPQGWVAKLEFKLRDKGYKRIASLLGRWDERNLGR